MITREKFLRRSAALGGALIVGAALGGASVGGPDGLASVGRQTDKSTLIVASADTPQNLDMQQTVHFPSLEVVTSNLYDPLVEFKKKGIGGGHFTADFSGLRGKLAQSWRVSKDGRTWTVKLRRGVKSAAGNELTSADVKWTWDRIWNLKGLGIFYYNTLNMKPDDIKAIDKYTVSFTTAKPAATFLCDMQQFAALIVDSTEAKKHTSSSDPWARDWLAKNAAGFGPYTVESWTPGQQMVLRAWNGYYGGAPKIKRVIYRAVPEASNRLALLLNGTVDMAEDLSPGQLVKVRSSRGVKDVWWPRGSRFIAILMNVKKKPFTDVRVRRAMAYATPYADIAKTVYRGRARRMTTIFPSSFPFATNRFDKYRTDYTKARALLRAAGYPNGFSMTYSYNAAISEEEEIGILMRSSLKKVGVKLNLDKLPPSIFTQKLQAKAFPFVLFLDQPICPNPGYALFLYYVTKSLVNYTNYSNKKVDRLVAQGLATLAPNKARPIWFQVQKLVTQDSPWIFLTEPGVHLGVRSTVRGATWYPINLFQFHDFSKTS